MPIAEVETIWMNGELVPWHEAKVHVLSHALHYGSGVFEGIRAYETARGPAVWHLDAHLGRMFDSAAIYHMEIPYSKEQLVQATKDVIRANDLPACYIRPIAFRGYGEIGVNPLANPVDVSIAVVAVGRLPRRGGARAGRPRQDRVVEAPRPELAAVVGEGHRRLPRLDPREDRLAEVRLRRGGAAEPRGPHR